MEEDSNAEIHCITSSERLLFMTTTVGTRSTFDRDRWRQLANIVFALAQVIVTFIGYLFGSNTNFSQSNNTTPQVVPQDYAFAIWSLIYLGALAYAVYQLLPAHKEDSLLRRIGFYTASTYLATTVWLIAAQSGSLWLPVICIFWILASLVAVMIQFILYPQPFTRAERWLVVVPASIYAGWATVAAIANSATALQTAGFSNVLLSNQNWAILMLVIGGLIASFVTWRSRGNTAYALTIVWALIGVIVANIVRTPSIQVASVAAIMAVLIVAVLLYARVTRRTHVVL
jgi:hypothetical protein